MADFLRFKGAKSVTKQQGTEMRLRRPPNGGDTFQTKRWWGGKGKVVYISAAIFAVSTSGDDVQLVIPTDNETTAVSIRHDGAGNFTFSDFRGVDRIAVYNADRSTLLAEYQFPSISGGSVLKRTISTFVEPPAPEPEPEPEPEPPAEPTFAERVEAATFTYVVGINNIGTEELPQNVYTLNGLDGPGIAGAVGDSFYFDFSAVSPAHPLGIFTDAGKTTPVTVGVYTEGDGLVFEPPIAGTFSYQCINHSNMGGIITVSEE